jgi:integrase
MALTATAVTNAKPKEKDYKLRDERGLYLFVTAQGGRYWRFNYRYDGKYRTLALGTFPDVSLADARQRREGARQALAEGEDPIDRRKRIEREERAKRAETFTLVATEWLERLEKEGRAPKTMQKMRWLVDFATPALGSRPIADITTLEILDVLRKVEARGRYETAIRLRGTIGAILRFAVVTGRAARDITVELHGALITPKRNHHAAIIEPKAVGDLLRTIDSYEGQPEVQFALKIAPHVFVRPGELRGAEWDEFDLDIDVWTIPATKTKMRRRHRVPLSPQVKCLLLDLLEVSGRSKYLFPSVRSPLRTISENTINAALRRMGYDQTEMTGHGFRAMASTLLNEMGKWHPDAIERQLGHIEENEVRRAYSRGEYWPERVRMMQAWSDYLDRLKEQKRPGR